MNRRKLLVSMTNMAASWRAILSGFFHSASLTEATLGPGPATNTGEPGIAGVPESQSRQGPPNIEDYATIEAIVNGEPVYCLDYIGDILDPSRLFYLELNVE